jgi:hypothetical protein
MDLHTMPDRRRRATDKDFILPNDRGALLGEGTFRLPLDRHLCAETLWRFFGDMGEYNSDAESTNKLLVSQFRQLNEFHTRWVLVSDDDQKVELIFQSIRVFRGSDWFIAKATFLSEQQASRRNLLRNSLHSNQIASRRFRPYSPWPVRSALATPSG